MEQATGSHCRYFIVGGAGFIGSHFADRLLREATVPAVTLYDNFSSGRAWHFAHHLEDPRFRLVEGDARDLEKLTAAMAGHHTVIHLASNPDIAKASTEPSIDFDQGTVLTHNVLEAMRVGRVSTILYASGSGVYGDLGALEIDEDHGPLVPISTYGASKLAGESLISAYCHMFGLSARLFRFANVVGPRQTHGVGLDFIRALLRDGRQLTILGDGSQSKSYIHIDDVVSAVLLAERHCTENYAVFNVATGDYITVREIAELAIETVGLAAPAVRLNFGQGPRGWRGDIPVVRLNAARIKGLGWVCANSSKQALGRSMAALMEDMRAGKI